MISQTLGQTSNQRYVVRAGAYYMMHCGCENQTKYVVSRPIGSVWSRSKRQCSQETCGLFHKNLKIVHDLFFGRLTGWRGDGDCRGGGLASSAGLASPVSQGQVQACVFHPQAILGAWVLCISQSLASCLGFSPLLYPLLLPQSASKGERQ